MSATDEIEDVCERMRRVRSNMGEEVETFVQSTRVLLDWRHYVSQAPFLCIAAAALAGYLAVPVKPRPVPAAPQFAASGRKSKEEEDVESTAGRVTLAAALLDLAAPVVWKVGRALIMRQLDQFLNPRAPQGGPSPTNRTDQPNRKDPVP